MPQIVTDHGLVHYEAVGSGPPVILIHGYTQSWDTWRSTIETFERHYRMYAPDLWGFGLSDKERRTSFKVADFIDLIPQFMDSLGLTRVALMGHSMGGTTALGVALKYPDRVRKVAVVGSPIVGSSLSPFLKLMAVRAFANVMLLGETKPLMRAFIRLWSYLVSPTAPDEFYNRYIGNMRYSLDSFVESIDSLRRVDLRPQLGQLSIPAMGIYGTRDVIVNPNQEQVFRRYVPHGRAYLIKGAGHFVMWDNPAEFNQAFQEFMEM